MRGARQCGRGRTCAPSREPRLIRGPSQIFVRAWITIPSPLRRNSTPSPTSTEGGISNEKQRTRRTWVNTLRNNPLPARPANDSRSKIHTANLSNKCLSAAFAQRISELTLHGYELYARFSNLSPLPFWELVSRQRMVNKQPVSVEVLIVLYVSGMFP